MERAETEIDFSGRIGMYDLAKLSYAELLQLNSILSPIAIAGPDRGGGSA